jgi:hypothetical protein
MAASAVLFLFSVIEKKLPRASPTQEFSHSLDPMQTSVGSSTLLHAD